MNLVAVKCFIIIIIIIIIIIRGGARQGKYGKFSNRLKYGDDLSKGLVSKTGWLAEAASR